MAGLFNPRLLVFYGSSLAAAIALFSTATGYGETRLKAPLAIAGQYPLQLQPAANCLTQSPVILHLQQSGIYLTGSLLAANTPTHTVLTAAKRPTLTGKWDGQTLTLKGATTDLPACDGAIALEATSQGTDQPSLQGLIRTDSGNIAFGAKRAETAATAESVGH